MPYYATDPKDPTRRIVVWDDANHDPQTFVRMRLPDSMGRTIVCDGRSFQADREGVVSVPATHVEQLVCHGLTRVDS